MYAIKFPNGKIDQLYVGNTKREVWYERGFLFMCDKYGENWKNEFWKRNMESQKDFKRKGYNIVRVKVKEISRRGV